MSLQVMLETKINQFVEEVCNKDLNDEYNGYYYPQLVEDMVKAAAIVFDASFKAQDYQARSGI